MPDLTDFAITRQDAAQINVPCYRISGKLIESDPPHAILADFTGDNAINWPGDLAALTQDQQDEIANDNALKMVNMKAGF